MVAKVYSENHEQKLCRFSDEFCVEEAPSFRSNCRRNVRGTSIFASVKRKVELPVIGLETFTSTMSDFRTSA